MSLELSSALQFEDEPETQYTDDLLCELSKEASSDRGECVTSVERYKMMAALAEGGLLLRAGRLIKLEDRTKQNKFQA